MKKTVLIAIKGYLTNLTFKTITANSSETDPLIADSQSTSPIVDPDPFTAVEVNMIDQTSMRGAHGKWKRITDSLTVTDLWVTAGSSDLPLSNEMSSTLDFISIVTDYRREVTEFTHSVELLSIDVAKLLEEVASSSDQSFVAVDKRLNDDANVDDNFEKSVDKTFSDISRLSDALAKDISKSLFDSIQASDSVDFTNSEDYHSTDLSHISEEYRVSLLKQLSESGTSADIFSKQLSKNLFEALTVSELFSSSEAAGLLFNDSEESAAIDVITASINKALEESPALIDVLTKSLALNWLESAYVFDELRKLSTKTVADFYFSSDLIDYSIGKNLNESPLILEAISKDISFHLSDSAIAYDTFEDMLESGEGIFKNPSDMGVSSDLFYYSFSNVLSDFAQIDDPLAFSYIKLAEDTSFLSDSLTITGDFWTAGDNELNISELHYFSISQIINDSNNIADVLSKALAKYITDNASAFDSIDVLLASGLTRTDSDVSITSDVLIASIFKLLNESTNLSETLRYIFGKGVADSGTTDDLSQISVIKNNTDLINYLDVFNKSASIFLSDTITATDTFNDLISSGLTYDDADTPTTYEVLATTVFKSLNDSTNISESLQKDLARLVNESSIVIDSNVLSIGKHLDEIGFVDETLSTSFAKALNDLSSVSESLSKNALVTYEDFSFVSDLRSFFINLIKTESTNSADVFSNSSDKNVIDTSVTLDSLIKDIGINLQDGALVSELLTSQSLGALQTERSDNSNISDLLNITGDFWTSGDNEFNVSELLVKTVNLSRIDTGVTSDTGTLNIQNYVDAGYFSEDYVGTNYNF
jgi:hypothetical protein